MDSIKINSNINLYYIPMTKLKTTTIGVYIHRPLNSRDVSKNAVLPYVLKRGCRLCPDSESISKYLENLYGVHFGTASLKMGDEQIIYLGFETISDRYAEGEAPVSGVIKLMISVLFEPAAFTDEVTEQEKKNAADRITAAINNKAAYAMRRCGEIMCEGDSFALSPLGTIDGVREITAGGLKEHYEQMITSSVIDIYVCGECDINSVGDEIKRGTEHISFMSAALPKSKIFTRSGDIKNATDRMDVTQGKLSMGFRTETAPDSSDYPALMLLNSIYGGGAHSKLFANVREKLSLCYYASSSLVRGKGIMFVNAGIEFKDFEKARDEILAQLENVKNGEISDLEFTSSVNALLNDLESKKDDQQLTQTYYLSERVSGTDRTIDELKSLISAVTKEDVIRAARKVRPDTIYFLTGKEEN